MNNYQKEFLTGVGMYLVAGTVGLTNSLLNRY